MSALLIWSAGRFILARSWLISVSTAWAASDESVYPVVPTGVGVGGGVGVATTGIGVGVGASIVGVGVGVAGARVGVGVDMGVGFGVGVLQYQNQQGCLWLEVTVAAEACVIFKKSTVSPAINSRNMAAPV